MISGPQFKDEVRVPRAHDVDIYAVLTTDNFTDISRRTRGRIFEQGDSRTYFQANFVPVDDIGREVGHRMYPVGEDEYEEVHPTTLELAYSQICGAKSAMERMSDERRERREEALRNCSIPR